MLVPSPAAWLALASSLAALSAAFPLGNTGSPQQVQLSRFQLKNKVLPGCYYTCPPLTDEVPEDFGVDADDSQGVSLIAGSTTCGYSAFRTNDYIECRYDDQTGRLLTSTISPSSSPSPGQERGEAALKYAGCAPFALAKNDRGRGTCVRSAAEKQKDEKTELARARVRRAQWTKEKLVERERARKEKEDREGK